MVTSKGKRVIKKLQKRIWIQNKNKGEKLYIKIGVEIYTLVPGEERNLFIDQWTEMYFEGEKKGRPTPHKCCKKT